MMGSENQETSHLDSSSRDDDMESLVLHDDDLSDHHNSSNNLTSKSYSNYKSTMTTPLSSSSSFDSSAASHHHPLSSAAADSDPLLSPPSPPFMKSPNSINKKTNNDNNPHYYADVIVSPLEEANGDEKDSEFEKSPSFVRSPSSSTDYLEIKVSNPQKEVESSNSIVPGNNTYITYLITTKTNISDYGGDEFNVRRRFRDVITLSDRLHEGYRGFFIPPRPDKSIVESQVMQKQEFVEQRRVALEKYLRRLAMHPVIKKSDELRVFLQVQGKLPLLTSVDLTSRMLDGAVRLPKQLLGDSGTGMGPQDVVQPAKGGRDLLRMFKELKQSVSNDWGGKRPPVEEEDREFLENKERLHNLELQLTTASKQAESLVKSQQDLGETIGELGLAFIKLTKFENEEAMLNTQRARAGDMKAMATAAVKASRYYRGLTAHTVQHLDTLHDYMGLMLGVQNAFSDRSSALLTVQTLLSELSSMHSKAEKLQTASSKIFGGNKSRINKLEELNESIRVTEDGRSCAIKQYDRIKENNKSEIQRLDRERHVDFINMLKGFVSNQVDYMQKIGNEWEKAAEDTSRYAKK